MRFTIRDLLWLMVVVACLLGWWADRTSYAGRESRIANGWAQRLADATGESVHVSLPDGGEWLVEPTFARPTTTAPPTP